MSELPASKQSNRSFRQKRFDGLLVITKRLRRSAGDNDRRSKNVCSSAVLCISFTWQMVRTRVIRLRVSRRSKCAWSNCVLCIPFILSGSPNECYNQLQKYLIHCTVFWLKWPVHDLVLELEIGSSPAFTTIRTFSLKQLFAAHRKTSFVKLILLYRCYPGLY